MPMRKVTGAAHKDTVKSPKALEDGLAIVKRPLAALRLGKDGEIAGYYNKDSDRLLYDALKARLAEYGGDAAKAFAEPFYKPKSDGTPGSVVNKVKLTEPTTLSVPVQDGTGIADNDSMVRIDVFRVEGDGYYLVPIYVADTLKPELPNKAVVAFKAHSEWKVMSDDDFVFSLYPNDLVKITRKKDIILKRSFENSTLPETIANSEHFLYYTGADIATGAISCVTNDNAYSIRGLGLKTLKSMEKYTVDILGEYHPVRKEERQWFNIKRG